VSAEALIFDAEAAVAMPESWRPAEANAFSQPAAGTSGPSARSQGNGAKGRAKGESHSVVEATATATPSTPTVRPSPSSSFSPVIPSLSPSSSSSLPLGFLILDNEHDDLVLVEIRGAGTRDMD